VSLQLHQGALQIFDVEHGQCALLTMPGSGNAGCDRMLIDCGHNATSGWTPTDHLQGLGVTKLEMVVVTNYDEDHVSNFKQLAESGIEVGTLVRNMSVAPDYITHLKSETGMGCGIEALVGVAKRYTDTAAAAAVDTRFPGMKMQTFRNTPVDFDDENNLSLVLFLQVHNTNFLFPGDMECAGFEKLLANSAGFRAILPQVHVLVASHHGRFNGICEDLFDNWGLKPQLTVISDDYKQYDTQETTQYYGSKTSGINFRGSFRKVLTTRKDGFMNFSFQGGPALVL
jgi:beta-lactamase superfamily II metal-dependent hydrolase